MSDWISGLFGPHERGSILGVPLPVMSAGEGLVWWTNGWCGMVGPGHAEAAAPEKHLTTVKKILDCAEWSLVVRRADLIQWIGPAYPCACADGRTACSLCGGTGTWTHVCTECEDEHESECCEDGFEECERCSGSGDADKSCLGIGPLVFQSRALRRIVERLDGEAVRLAWTDVNQPLYLAGETRRGALMSTRNHTAARTWGVS